MKLFVLLSSLATLSFLVGATSHVDRIDHQETERDLSSFTGLVVSLELVNSTSDVKVATLTDGSIITATNPSFSVNAIVEGKGTRCVVLKWMDSTNKTRTNYETTAPYSLCANNGLDFFSCDALGYGKHQFSVEACSKSDGRSSSCSTPMVIAIEIIKPPTQSPSSSPSTQPSIAPTRAPSGTPTAVNCTASAIVFLNCNTLTKRTLSLTGATQEDKAAQWVIRNNPLLLPDTEANQLRLLQRYVIAAMLKDGIGQSSGNECGWFGVICDVNNAVTAVDWMSRIGALASALSKDLGLLTNLQYFIVNNNQLIGTIPTELGSWRNIQNFFVSNNQLTGTIPAEFGAWTSMQKFHVSNNQLSGAIPSELKAWTTIQSFLVHINRFTGTIPTELGVWTNIRSFYLYINQCTGAIPSELGAWINIEYFLVNKNQLTGTIPTSLGNWINSQQWFLFCNNFANPQNISFVCRAPFTPIVDVNGGLTCPCCRQFTGPC